MQLRFMWHLVMPCLPIILYNILNYLGIFSTTGNEIPKSLLVSFGITFYFVLSESIVGCSNCLEVNKSYINKTGLDILPCYLSVSYAVSMSFAIRYIALQIVLLLNIEHYSIEILYGPLLALIILIFGVSIGSIISIFVIFYKDIENIVRMLAFYMLFASGVFGLITDSTLVGEIVTKLPGYIFVTSSRSIVFGHEMADKLSFFIMVIISLIVCILAFRINKNAKALVLNHLK